jgi:hypothetical protein
VTVDEKQRPVLVVEACEGAATKVNVFLDREGLTDDEENEQVAARISDVPMPGTSELVLHAPAGPQAGQSVEVIVDRGIHSDGGRWGGPWGAQSGGFRGVDLAAMAPGTVNINDYDLHVRELVGLMAEDFRRRVQSRMNFGLTPPGRRRPGERVLLGAKTNLSLAIATA